MTQTRPRSQCAALPVRMTQRGPEVLLVTSRDTGRWILPKGWAKKGKKAHTMAAQEAFEEAGVVGTALQQPIGCYTYDKRLMAKKSVPCTVEVFLLPVEQELDDWPEKGQRRKQWMSPAQAARRISESGLIGILLGVRLPVS